MSDAPSTAPYLTANPEGSLPDSFTLVASEGLVVSDGGAQGNFTLDLGAKLLGFWNTSLDETLIVLRGGSYQAGGISSSATVASNQTYGLNLGVINNQTQQRINLQSSLVTQSTRSTINFIEGSNINITAVDNSVSDRIDLTFASVASVGGVSSFGIANPKGGLVIGGTNPITTSGTITIDLPICPPPSPKYFVLSAVDANGVKTCEWIDYLGGTVTSVGVTAGTGITATGTNPVTGIGVINLALNSGFSTIAANSDINMNGFSIVDGVGYVFTPTPSLNAAPASPYPAIQSVKQDGNVTILQMANYYNPSSSGTVNPAVGYMATIDLTTLGVFGTPQGYGGAGQILCGAFGSSNNLPAYQPINAPTDSGVYRLIFDNSNSPFLPSWNLGAYAHPKATVTLATTSVAPTTSGANIELGDGTYFVADANVTCDTRIICTPVGLYGSTEPALGPITVALNPTTATGELPVGFVIYGDPTFDNGKTVSYQILSYGSC